MTRPAPQQPDPWAAGPVAYVTVTAALGLICIGIVATTSGVRAGWIAAVLIYGGGMAAAVLLVLLVLLMDAARALRRRRYDRRRDCAFDGAPPGPAELADDFAAASIRIPYPANGGPAPRPRCPDCGMPRDLDPDHPAAQWCARVRSPEYQAHFDWTRRLSVRPTPED